MHFPISLSEYVVRELISSSGPINFAYHRHSLRFRCIVRSISVSKQPKDSNICSMNGGPAVSLIDEKTGIGKSSVLSK